MWVYSRSNYDARSERHCVCVKLGLGLACIAVVLVYSEDWQRNGGMRGGWMNNRAYLMSQWCNGWKQALNLAHCLSTAERKGKGVRGAVLNHVFVFWTVGGGDWITSVTASWKRLCRWSLYLKAYFFVPLVLLVNSHCHCLDCAQLATLFSYK